MTRKAIIAGAGIGGLSAAIALRRRGWDVQVLEQAPALSEVGAGVQIGPNGTRILEGLGVMPLLEASVFAPKAIEARIGHSGATAFHLPLGDQAVARWGARYLQVHRADLHQALTKALLDLAPDALAVGCRISGYDGAAVWAEDGTRYEGDLVVGADGLRSTLRAQMFGADVPQFAGVTAWRCLVEDADLAARVPDMGCIWMGPGRHVVTTKVRAGRVVNFVGLVDSPEPHPEDWASTAPKEAALQDFARFIDPIPQILQRAEVIHRWGLYTRPALPRWSDGPVALLGDAAHPMLPSMAQGAVQAMEDAVVLAQALDAVDDIPDALRNYSAARQSRTRALQRVSARNLRRFHKKGAMAWGFYQGLSVLNRFAPSLLAWPYDWIYGHRVST